MNKTVVFSIFSVIIPLAAYLFFLGVAPATHSDIRAYLPLLGFNAFGFALSVIALSRSNPKPTDTSLTIRLIVLFGNMGMLANTIAVESIISSVLSAAHP